MNRVWIIILLIAVFFNASLFGLPKTVIHVAVYPELDRAFITLISNFMKDYPDIGVRLVVNGFGDHHSSMTTYIMESPDFDVAAVDIQFIGQLGGGGGFENLLNPPYKAGKYKDHFVPYAWAQVSTSQSNLIAIPIDIGPACAYYRVDILKKYGIDYTKIKSLDDLYRVGLKVTKKGTNGEPCQWLLADDGDIFNMILKSDSIRYFNANGKPVLNRNLIKQAVLWQKKFYDAGLSGRIGAWSPEWRNALNADMDKGAVVFQPYGSMFAGYLSRFLSTNQSGNWRVANLPALKPGGKPMYAYWGGSFLAIPIYSKYKAEAWKFIEYVTTRVEPQIELFRKSNTFPAWVPVWDDPVVKEPIPYLGNQAARKLWMDIARKIPPVYIDEKDAVAANILAYYVSEVILSNKNVDLALNEAQKELENQLDYNR